MNMYLIVLDSHTHSSYSRQRPLPIENEKIPSTIDQTSLKTRYLVDTSDQAENSRHTVRLTGTSR